MLTTLISFLGGSAFRMLWGEIAAFFTARQEHQQELDRMRLQGELDAAAHARNLAAIKLQADLGVKTIEVQAQAAVSQREADAWLAAVQATAQRTGIWLVDLWNGVMRPLIASVCLFMILRHFAAHQWTLDDQGWALCGAALGIYLADRALFKRGK
jgi:hypothetical protein